jgi:hypothetical protein
LVLDHPDNDGAHHRATLGYRDPLAFYRHLRTNNYPTTPRLRVLCSNCNGAYANYYCCPHEDIAQPPAAAPTPSSSPSIQYSTTLF